MGTKIINLNSNLPFDEEQEKDIIAYVEGLKGSHKIGQFLATVIRAAFDSPELLEKKDGVVTDGKITKQIQDLGMTYDRYQFMRSVKKDVDDMKNKVDKIYDMVFKTYELALMGKHLGLEDKAKNEILANFILQKQVKELQDALGVQLTSSMFASNKAQDTEKLAEETLEYIINTYDSIVNELRKKTEVQQIVVQQSEVTEVKKDEPVVSSNNAVVEKVTGNDDEIVDYGIDNFEPDISALENFFGAN